MNVVRAVGGSGLLVAMLASPLVAEPPTCPDNAVGRVIETADGLQIVALSAPGLRPGDILLQFNSRTLHQCAELADAIAEAHEHQLAQLVLVRRGRGTEVVAVPTPVEVSAAAAIPQPATAKETPTPPAINRASAAPVRDFLDRLVEFGHSLRANAPLLTAQPWARQTADLRQTYEKQRTEVAAVAVVEPIVDYYQTIADILAYRDEAARVGGSARPQPNAPLGYNSGSQVSAWLRRYPFLETSVIAFPETTAFAGWAESNGRWLPDRAVELLVDHALADADTIAQRLDATSES